MMSEKPNRLIEIEKIINKYYCDDEPDEKIILVNKIKDKYKNELENFEYVKDLEKLSQGQEIRCVSRKNYKLSNASFIVDIERDEMNRVINIICKSNMSRIKKKMSYLKHFIFLYSKKDNNVIMELVENIA